MKKLKKLQAIILSFLMLVSFVPAYAFNIADDVAGTEFKESAYVLGALGIMVGDAGTGNFRPKDSITRAEFARVSVSLLGLDDIAKASMGQTKYKDVKNDHWATGYINVATDQKLIIGVGDDIFLPESEITYQDAVTILIRALGYEPEANAKGGYPGGFLATANKIGLTKNASSKSDAPVIRGIVANLSNNALTINIMEQTGFGSNPEYKVTDKTILKDKLKVVKDKGQITANGFSTLESASGLKKDEVKINDKIYKAGSSNAGNLLGKFVTFYAKENDDNVAEEIILARPDEGKNKIIETDGESIESASDKEVSYYVNKDKDTSSKKIKLSDDVKYIYNGIGIKKDHNKIPVGEDGSVSFLEVTGDDKYDVVFIDITKNLVVEDVILNSYKIIDKYGNETLTLDPKDDNVNFSMFDKDNNNVKLSDLKEWDILTYTISEDKSYIRIMLSRETVEGKVTETGENKFVISGKEYKVAKSYEEEIKLGDEGMFYLDAKGKIAAVNKITSLDRNYAYLINAGVNGSVDTKAIFKVLDNKGEIKTIEAEDKIKFNDISGKPSGDVVKELTGDDGIKKQLITFKTNKDNKITEIDTATDKSDDDLTIDKYDFVKNFKGEEIVYKSNSKKLGKFKITDKTIVFDIPEKEKDYNNYKVTDIKMFANDSTYNVSIFDVSENMEAGVVIVTNSDGKTNMDSPVAVVSKITTTRDDNGDEIQKLYAAYNGEIKTFLTSSSDLLKKDEGRKPLEAGDIIQIKFDNENKIDKFDLLFDVSKKDTEFSKSVGEKMTLVYGKVTKKFKDSVNISVNKGISENYSISDSLVYIYNSKKSSNNVTVATIGDIERNNGENDERVFLRIYDDVVKEIIIVK